MWHNKTPQDILQEFKTDMRAGLSDIEARKRFDEKGPNVLPKGKELQWWNFFIRQFKSPLVYILIIAAVFTAVIQEWMDMVIIIAAVMVNVAVGFWQEFRSSNILQKLKALVQVNALVIRDGELHEIDALQVVPGDLLRLKAGRKVPADARIVESHHLEVNEALLTGESAPVKKSIATIEHFDVSVGDRTNMVHMGTVVARGDGRAVVVATGALTEIGKIALLTQKAEDEPTPLQMRIGKLGKILAIFVGFASVFIFVIGILEEYSFKEMFTTAIAIAVAAIPEGLPASISIILAVSAQRILKRKGVVKQLVAAETLGSASVICADKTGTLTEGKMKVEQVITGGSKSYAYEVLALANEALIEKTGKDIFVRGETTDQAKMQVFLDEGGNLEELLKRYPRIDLLEFHPSRKYIASLHRVEESEELVLFITGAPEAIIALSVNVSALHGQETLLRKKQELLETTYKKLARKGYRMIALAERRIENKEGLQKVSSGDVDIEDEATRKELVRELTFVGFAAIRDPVRADVVESMKIARQAGVRPVMLTGDHKLTAQAVGRELGFNAADEVIVEGSQIDAMSDFELGERLRTVQIFARVNPSHKMRIVDILQKQGEVVAMTGDGVNDAPALKSANIGIALGSGTDVAKEASDLILLNNSFTIIVSAIKQGRIAFDNIRKVTVFLLVQSFTEIILILSALFLQLPLPLLVKQILWTNLIQDSFPNVALSFEPGEKDVMKRKPLKKNEPILDTESKIIVFVVGLFTDLLLLGLFFFLYHYSTLSLEYVRTFIFAGLGIGSFVYIYSIKSLRKPIFSYNIFDNPYLVGATVLGIGAMLAAIYVPFLSYVLGTAPLAAIDWTVIVGLGILKVLGIEFTKWWFHRRK